MQLFNLDFSNHLLAKYFLQRQTNEYINHNAYPCEISIYKILEEALELYEENRGSLFRSCVLVLLRLGTIEKAISVGLFRKPVTPVTGFITSVLV